MNKIEIDYPAVREFPQRIYVADRAREDQNLLLGILGGLITAAICSVVWAAITIISGKQMILMAIFTGYFVGSSIRISGRGSHMPFRVWGAILSLAGCVAGNLLSAAGIIAEGQPATAFDVLLWLDPFTATETLLYFYHPVDLIFYFLAGYMGFRFSVKVSKAKSQE